MEVPYAACEILLQAGPGSPVKSNSDELRITYWIASKTHHLYFQDRSAVSPKQADFVALSNLQQGIGQTSGILISRSPGSVPQFRFPVSPQNLAWIWRAVDMNSMASLKTRTAKCWPTQRVFSLSNLPVAVLLKCHGASKTSWGSLRHATGLQTRYPWVSARPCEQARAIGPLVG